MGYTAPHGDCWVSADWYNHCCERNPPSSEPGTDYACAYGSQVKAAGAGRISDLKSSNSSATGRYVTIDLDDGRRVRYLHLSAIYVSVGNRVSAGAIVAASGASGNGSDWWYGAHDHTTLWGCWCYNFCSTCTLDFQKYVGTNPPKPNPPEDDMKVSSFSKKLALGPDGTQTIKDGESAFLQLQYSPVNTKLATGPDSHISAVLSLHIESLSTDPNVEAIQVEPYVSERQKDNSLKDTALGRQEVKGTPGQTRAMIPMETRLDSEKKYLRVKVYSPKGAGTVKILNASLRGAEFTN